MKNIFIIISFVLVNFSGLFAQSDSLLVSENDNVELLRFEKMSYDLGKVKKGDVLFFDIKFKNISNVPVLVDFVSSCDCTEVDYPMEEILPGKTGVLKVKFDSKDKEESETTDIDVFLMNKDEETGSQIYYTLEYSFELTK